MRSFLSNPRIISIVLVLQLIPFVLFPPDTYKPTSQEWWLPALLAVMALVAAFQLVIRHTVALWPWYLTSFAQGFNIISRLLMLMPHSTINVEGTQRFNTSYVVLTLLSIFLSIILLWYVEKPDVRIAFLKEELASES